MSTVNEQLIAAGWDPYGSSRTMYRKGKLAKHRRWRSLFESRGYSKSRCDREYNLGKLEQMNAAEVENARSRMRLTFHNFIYKDFLGSSSREAILENRNLEAEDPVATLKAAIIWRSAYERWRARSRPVKNRIVSAEIIAVAQDSCSCWIDLANGLKIRTAIDRDKLQSVPLRPGQQFFWSLDNESVVQKAVEVDSIAKQRLLSEFERLQKRFREELSEVDLGIDKK